VAARLIALLTFMVGAMVALLWVMVELGDSVAAGADWIWYLALVLTLVPALVFAVTSVRWRSRGPIILTVASTVLLVAVVLTHPNSGAACRPGTTAQDSGTTDTSGLGDVLVDDSGSTDATASTGDCP
jgi:hypothetical protein